MTLMNDSPQSLALQLSRSIFLNAYAELEDALNWNYELLIKLDTRAIEVIPGKPCVTDRAIAIRKLLEFVSTDKKPSISTSDEILRECLMAQDFYERVVSRSVSSEEPLVTSRPRGLLGSDEIRLQAGKMLGLAAKVLSLHALYRPVIKVERCFTGPFRDLSRKDYRVAS